MKAFIEFVGSFLFMFTIAMAVPSGSPLAPLAIGAGLMAMVYMGGHISGAHYNPAVSVAMLIRGKLEAKDFLPYVVCQILGGVAAFAVAYWILGQSVAIAPSESAGIAKAIVVEIIFTFALCIVVLNVATHKKVATNSFYGLAIGFTIAAAVMAGGPHSGGAFNPAVAIGAAVSDATLHGGTFSNLWIYLVGPFLGGILAAAVFKVTAPDAD